MLYALLYGLVCGSNFYGFYALNIEKNNIICLFLVLAIFASFAMHLYEEDRYRYNLHITELKKDNVYNTLVYIDKFFAYTLIGLYNYYYPYLFLKYIHLGIPAVIICIISTEIQFAKDHVWFFAITHTIWHIMAFHIAYLYSSD